MLFEDGYVRCDSHRDCTDIFHRLNGTLGFKRDSKDFQIVVRLIAPFSADFAVTFSLEDILNRILTWDELPKPVERRWDTVLIKYVFMCKISDIKLISKSTSLTSY